MIAPGRLLAVWPLVQFFPKSPFAVLESGRSDSYKVMRIAGWQSTPPRLFGKHSGAGVVRNTFSVMALHDHSLPVSRRAAFNSVF
jgi:hypothetical protein